MIATEPTVLERLTDARALFEKGRYYDARAAYEAIRFDYPGDDVMGEVQFRIALCHFHLKDYLSAEHEFRYFQRDFKETHELSAEVHYWLCRSLFEQALPARLDQSATQRVIEECSQFMDQFKSSEFYLEVLKIKRECDERIVEKEYLAGKQYRRMGYPSSAIHYFRQIEQNHRDSRWIAAVRYEWALLLYNQKEYPAALSMADSCASFIARIEENEKANFIRIKPYSSSYKFFHFFGLIPYERRSELKIYIDDLKESLALLVSKIKKHG